MLRHKLETEKPNKSLKKERARRNKAMTEKDTLETEPASNSITHAVKISSNRKKQQRLRYWLAEAGHRRWKQTDQFESHLANRSSIQRQLSHPAQKLLCDRKRKLEHQQSRHKRHHH